MARKRMVSPTYFTSRPVSLLTIPAMVTLIGLWTYCDDYGRGDDDAVLVKASVWPRRPDIDETAVAAHLDEIGAHELLCRYDVAGYTLLHFPSWFEHQTISHKTPSKIPPCPLHEPGLWDVFASDSGGPLEKYRRDSRITPHNVVKGSSDQSKVVQGAPADGECRHGAPIGVCYFCKQQTRRAAS